MIVIILTTGSLYYIFASKNYKVQISEELSAIADMKVHELEQWRKERLSNAELFYDNLIFADEVKSFFKNPNDSVTIRNIKNWMNIIYQAEFFNGVFFEDNLFNKKIIISEAIFFPTTRLLHSFLITNDNYTITS